MEQKMNISEYLNAKLEQYDITEKEFVSRLPKGLFQVSKKWFSGNSKPNTKSRFEINKVIKELFLLKIINVNKELEVERSDILELLLEYYLDSEELNIDNLEERHNLEVSNLNKMIEEMKNFSTHSSVG